MFPQTQLHNLILNQKCTQVDKKNHDVIFPPPSPLLFKVEREHQGSQINLFKLKIFEGEITITVVYSNSASMLSEYMLFCSSSSMASSSSSSTSVCSADWAIVLMSSMADAPRCGPALAWAACHYGNGKSWSRHYSFMQSYRSL